MTASVLPSLNVGFQKNQPIGAFRQFLYSLLAFLTAKTLPLGLESGAAARAGTISDVFRPIVDKNGRATPFEIPWSSYASRYWIEGRAIGNRHMWIGSYGLTIGRDFHPLTTDSGDEGVFVRHGHVGVSGRGDVGRTAACSSDYNFCARKVVGNLASYHSSRVLYSPAFCARALLVDCIQDNIDNRLCLRATVPDIERPRLAPVVIGGIVFAVMTVMDVLVGAVMRGLQVPYFVMMYIWHNFGGPCFFAKIDEHSKRQVAVFRVRDQLFTCFAVAMNSVLVAAVLPLALGVSVQVDSAFAVAVLPLAVLTLAAMCVTVVRMRARNARFVAQSDTLAEVVWCRKAGDDVVQTAPGLPADDESGAVKAERRRTKWDSACQPIAQIMYIGEVVPGAYLPAHFSAGYCGATAFSFVEELCHFVPHILSSITIAAVEYCYTSREGA